MEQAPPVQAGTREEVGSKKRNFQYSQEFQLLKIGANEIFSSGCQKHKNELCSTNNVM